MAAEKNEYLVDVAGERHYQSQTRPYREAFTKWRNHDKNKYGYRFVHDSREHTYIDGEGFADKQCKTAETKALHSCLQFLGLIMLIFLVLEQLSSLILILMYDRGHITWNYFSQRAQDYMVPSEQVFLYCGLKLFSIATIITISDMVLKLPRQVVIPHERQKPAYLISGTSLILILTIILRIFDYGTSNLFAAVNIDSTYYSYISTDSTQSQILFFIFELILIPALTELFFRGMILQLFRQFGDNFAILISSLAAACCYHEMSKIFFIFILSMALGVFTVKSGSVFPAIAAKVLSLNLTYLLNSFTLLKNRASVRMTGALLSIVLLALFTIILLMLHGKLIRPFKLEHDTTEMDMRQKSRQLLNSSWCVIWLTAALLTAIVSLRFI